MTEPKIDEQLFQAWIQDQSQAFVKGTRRLDDLVLLCGSAFNDGWLQALSPSETR